MEFGVCVSECVCVNVCMSMYFDGQVDMHEVK